MIFNDKILLNKPENEQKLKRRLQTLFQGALNQDKIVLEDVKRSSDLTIDQHGVYEAKKR